jgi:tetratricopeptide (TPR) repeat protein
VRPPTAAEAKAAEVRARTGGRQTSPEKPARQEAYEPDQWIDEGSVRDAADAATARAGTPPVRVPGRRAARSLDVETLGGLERAVGARRSARLADMLAQARDALERDRFEESRRLARTVTREAPDVAEAQEVAGLAAYRLGRWREAVVALEAARAITRSIRNHAVLADSYRAQRKYAQVEELWREVREASPEPAQMAEARIVAAGALADQGDLAGAINVMGPVATKRKVREYHLKQWYVLGDLYDRSGDVVRARQLFEMVLAHDPDFADTAQRLRALGR